MKKEINLAIQTIRPENNVYGLGLSTKDHKNVLTKIQNANELKIVMYLSGSPIVIKEDPKAYLKFRRLTNPEISNWIVKNKYFVFPKDSPIKIKFIQVLESNYHIYILCPTN